MYYNFAGFQNIRSIPLTKNIFCGKLYPYDYIVIIVIIISIFLEDKPK